MAASRWTAFDIDEIIEIHWGMQQWLQEHESYKVKTYIDILNEITEFMDEAYHLVNLEGK